MTVTIEKIIEIVEAALELSPGTVNADSTTESLDAWDSLGHISILVSLDKELGDISERQPEVATAKSIQEIFELAIRDHV